MDFSKAFDRVDHTLLIEVLLNSGFGEQLLSWFQSYHQYRKEIVDVHGIKSIIIDEILVFLKKVISLFYFLHYL